MGGINFFESVFKTQVKDVMDIYTIMEDIKNPLPEIRDTIQTARRANEEGNIKLNKDCKITLPCHTFNFMFDKKRGKNNILSPTGLIYINQQYSVDIDFNNEYIFATWLSVSGKGRVILVKVEELSLDNFLDIYFEVSKLCNVHKDNPIGFASQPTFHSYDPNLYFNNDSKVYKYEKIDYWEESLIHLSSLLTPELMAEVVKTKTD